MKTISFKLFLFACLCLTPFVEISSQILVEAESFANKGGWVTDQQFMAQMGSPYIMAHGMGVPVAEYIFPEIADDLNIAASCFALLSDHMIALPSGLPFLSVASRLCIEALKHTELTR